MIYFDNKTVPAVEAFTFPGGERQVRIKHKPSRIVTAVLKNSDGIMDLMLTTDAIRRAGGDPGMMTLIIPYFPYARQDKVSQEGEAVGVAVLAEMVNALGYRKVMVFDAHSPVLPAVLKKVHHINAMPWLGRLLTLLDPDTLLVAPDSGARGRVAYFAGHLGRSYVAASKTRDPETGKVVTDPLHAAIPENRTCLIVDDICDGGATFVGLAEELRRRGAARVYLFVTHGIFSKGAQALAGIDRVFCSNSLMLRNDEQVDALLELALDQAGVNTEVRARYCS